MADFSFMARDGSIIACHKVIAAALSPFMLTLLKGSEVDQVILADSEISEICALMNFYYTGK